MGNGDEEISQTACILKLTQTKQETARLNLCVPPYFTIESCSKIPHDKRRASPPTKTGPAQWLLDHHLTNVHKEDDYDVTGKNRSLAVIAQIKGGTGMPL